MSFVSIKQKDKVCWNIEIEIEGSEDFHFVDKQMVLSSILDLGDSILGTPMEDIELGRIKNAVQNMHAVDRVEATKTLDGQLKVTLSQRVPVLRVFFADGSSIYVDKDKQAMPLVPHYSAHVPVIVGQISGSADYVLAEDPQLHDSNQLQACFDIVDAIQNDVWMQNLCEHIAVADNGDFILIPRVGNHKINLGNERGLDTKFKKLKAFYKETIGTKDLNKYTTINLKYRDQVVCTKRAW